MLNAKFKKAPRVAEPWEIVSSCDKPPFPKMGGTTAFSAMEELQLLYAKQESTQNLLDVLRCVFKHIDNHSSSCDK